MPAATDSRPQPQLRKAPRWPFWTDDVRPWLGRRARRGSSQLTDRLGGPARRRVIVLLGLVLALSAADSSSVGAIAAQLQPALGIGTAELGLLVTVSSLVGALAAIPFGILVDKTATGDRAGGQHRALGRGGGGERLLDLVRDAAAHAPPAGRRDGDGRAGRRLPDGRLLPGRGARPRSTATSSPARWSAPAWASACPLSSPPPSAGGRRSSCSPCRASLWPGRCGPGCRSPPAAGRAGWSPGRRGSCRPKRPARRRRAARDEAVRTDDAVLAEVRKRGVRHDEDTVVVADPATMSLWQVVRYVLRVRTNVYLIVASSLGYLFLAGIRTFAVLFARGHFDVGQAMATLILGLVGAGSLLGLLTAGRLADRWIERGRIDARIVVAGVAFILSAALFVPALLSTSFIVSLPLLFLGLAALSAPNPPLDAAQLDVVPAQLWGRAQGVRTALRNTLEAFGPLLFGVILRFR